MTDKKTPSPEEIQREFEDFLKKRFGNSVQIISQSASMHEPESPSIEVDEGSSDSSNWLEAKFDLKPKALKAYLDRFVIRQDDAKKALSIAVCDHYNRVLDYKKSSANAGEEYAKQNVLVIGPTGVGKTYMIKQIAKLIGVPFVKADATRFSETGYMGANVDDLIRDLVAQADGNIEAAECGIVYLDEADKLTSPPYHPGRDVSGRGVQLGLLKIMEETEVDLRAGNDPASQMQAMMDFQRKGKVDKQVINTRHILFIVSGAFNGLVDIIKRRLNTKDIGFHADKFRVVDDDFFLKRANTQDFIDFGFEPEFIGRLPVRVACQHLRSQDLFDILRDSEGSILRQYQKAFKSYGIDIAFSEGALKKIAELAATEKTGARGLMTIFESKLRDFKFELPSSQITELMVNEAIVENPKEELQKLLNNPEHTRGQALQKRLRTVEDEFCRKHHMHINFSHGAGKLIFAKAQEAGVTIQEYCADLLQSYEHGLKLIKQNTGQTSFELGESVIEDPKAALEGMIRESYLVKPNK
jgi:endopeptidase Clp ATP-binding regulatory subunit ClpX